MGVDRNYLETFYEVVSYMSLNSELERVYNADGTDGKIDLAIELTDKFQENHKDFDWNCESSFYDEIDNFLETELN